MPYFPKPAAPVTTGSYRDRNAVYQTTALVRKIVSLVQNDADHSDTSTLTTCPAPARKTPANSSAVFFLRIAADDLPECHNNPAWFPMRADDKTLSAEW